MNKIYKTQITLENAGEYPDWYLQFWTALASKNITHTIDSTIEGKYPTKLVNGINKDNKYIQGQPLLNHKGQEYCCMSIEISTRHATFPGTKNENVIALGILRSSISNALSLQIPFNCDFVVTGIEIIKTESESDGITSYWRQKW